MRVESKLIWSGNTTPMNFESVTVKQAEGVKSNSMEIVLNNKEDYLSDGEFKFSLDDGFELFGRVKVTQSTSLDTSTTSDDLIFSGKLKKIKFQEDGVRRRVVLSCVDRSYDLFNKLWGKSYSDTTDQIIVNVLEQVTYDGAGGNTITIQEDATSPYTNGIQTKRPDGSNFPTVQFGLSNKPVFEWLDNLSQVEYTNSRTEINNDNKICLRPMRYYLDRYNLFHWFYPTDTPNYYMEYGATGTVSSDTKTHRIKSLNLEYGVFGEINFIIYKAGEDMDNVQILDYALDPTAKSLTTADSFRAWEHIAREMKREDLGAGNITFVKGDEYDYPSSYSPPIVPAWNLDVTVSSDSEYNDEFREEAIRRGDGLASNEFTQTGDPRWKGKITLIGETFQPTEAINFTYSDLGINNVQMRIKQVNHTINKNEFITTLNVEEEIPER